MARKPSPDPITWIVFISIAVPLVVLSWLWETVGAWGFIAIALFSALLFVLGITKRYQSLARTGIRKNWWVYVSDETLIQFHSPEVLVGGFNLCTWLKASSISTGPLLSRSGEVSQSLSHFGNLVLNGTFFRCSGAGFRPAPSRFPPTIRTPP